MNFIKTTFKIVLFSVLALTGKGIYGQTFKYKLAFQVDTSDLSSYLGGSTFGQNGKKLLMMATDRVVGFELFEWNDTAVKLVKDYNPGAGSSGVDEIMSYGSNFFFAVGFTSSSVDGIYRYSGSGTPTRIIASSDIALYPGYSFEFNNKLYFSMYTSTTGIEPYTVDKSGNLAIVKDLVAGTSGSYPRGFAAWNGKLYMGTKYNGIFEVNGSTVTAVKQIADSMYVDEGPIFSLNGLLFFTGAKKSGGKYGLYAYDGFSFKRISDYMPIQADPYSISSPVVLRAGNAVYYMASDVGPTSTVNNELFRFDGVNPPKQVLPKLTPGSKSTTLHDWYYDPTSKLAYFTLRHQDSSRNHLYVYDYDSMFLDTTTGAIKWPEQIVPYKNKVYVEMFKFGVNTELFELNYTSPCLPVTAHVSYTDTEACAGSTIQLVGSSYGRHSKLQWQKSSDGINYVNDPGKTNLSYYIVSDQLRYYRLINKDSLCTYADTSKAVKVRTFAAIGPALGPDKTLAGTDSVVLNPGIFKTYLWSNFKNTQTITVKGSDLSSGTNLYWVAVTDDHGCAKRDTILLTRGTVGYAEKTANTRVKLYPNPVQNELYIDAGKDIYGATVVIYSPAGRQLYRGVQNGQPIDISGLPCGLYFLCLEKDGRVLTSGFVKQ